MSCEQGALSDELCFHLIGFGLVWKGILDGEGFSEDCGLAEGACVDPERLSSDFGVSGRGGERSADTQRLFFPTCLSRYILIEYQELD